MSKKRDPSGPQFVRYFNPVLDALKALGGSGTPSEVKYYIAEKQNISEAQQNETTKSGESRFGNKVAWARFYLMKGGFLEEASPRGIWSLTEKGRHTILDDTISLKLFREIHQTFKQDENSIEIPTQGDVNPVGQEQTELQPPIQEDHRTILKRILHKVSPAGFERLCQRLLRESGFERVQVTGKSNDGGIDGIGILQITPLVSFKVLFQCKRYVGAVSASQIRDFRGAMSGRADKGIVITTGTFTSEANREAVRDGAPPIELVDGEKLIDMFEQLELGLKPKKAFDVNEEFFKEFS